MISDGNSPVLTIREIMDFAVDLFIVLSSTSFAISAMCFELIFISSVIVFLPDESYSMNARISLTIQFDIDFGE